MTAVDWVPAHCSLSGMAAGKLTQRELEMDREADRLAFVVWEIRGLRGQSARVIRRFYGSRLF